MKFNKTLLGGSLILLITFNLFNILNFVYQFLMARFLTISEYGTLAAIFSIIYIGAILSESVQTLTAKYSSTEKDDGKLKNAIKRFNNKVLRISLSILFLYLIASIFLSNLLKIPYLLLALNGIIVLGAIFVSINRGILQGKKKFALLGSNLIIESTIKIISSLFLVIIGFKVYGAILGFIIGILVALAVSLINIRPIMSSKEKPAKLDFLKIQATPVIFITAFIVLFYSIDVLIAKIVFTPEIAGFYSIASILAKVIFWGSQPISKAMFPLTSESSNNKNNRRALFFNALSIILLCIFIALVVFYLFPDFIVSIFAGKSLPESASILFYVSIATSLVAITNLNLLYNISTGKTRNYQFLLIFIIIEAALMFYFSSNLIEFTTSYILSAAIFLIGSVILLRHENRNNYSRVQ